MTSAERIRGDGAVDDDGGSVGQEAALFRQRFVRLGTVDDVPPDGYRFAQMERRNGITTWFMGLSGSGKTTLTVALTNELRRREHMVLRLDGEVLRRGMSRGLGFDTADRNEHLRRAAEVAKLANESGMFVIGASITPREAHRETVRGVHGDVPFRLVYLKTPLAVCEERDPKGLYARARAGDLPSFTGISAPFDPPPSPDLTLHPYNETVDATVAQVVDWLERTGALVAGRSD